MKHGTETSRYVFFFFQIACNNELAFITDEGLMTSAPIATAHPYYARYSLGPRVLRHTSRTRTEQKLNKI